MELLLELLVAAPVGVLWPHLERELRPEGELGARVLLVGPVLHSDLPNYVGVGGLSILDRDQRFFLLLEGTYEHNGLVERSCVSQENAVFVLALLLLRHRRRGELLQNGVQRELGLLLLFQGVSCDLRSRADGKVEIEQVAHNLACSWTRRRGGSHSRTVALVLRDIHEISSCLLL